RSRGPSAPVGSPLTDVSISVFDNCRNIRLLYAQGWTDQQQTILDPNLNSGSVHAIVPSSDSISGAVVDVRVDLTWDGAGKADHTAINFTTQLPGLTVSDHSRGAIREAVATGSVTIGT